ncbi:MAG: hypothetical protein U0I25_07670 [Oscillospiraceae bacterium]|nr:hypothetical protein [Oscillospiraceae bacterium]
MNSQELLEFLERAKDLEVALYKLDQIHEYLLSKEYFDWRDRLMPPMPEEPHYESEVAPTPPVEPNYMSEGKEIRDLCMIAVLVGGGLWIATREYMTGLRIFLAPLLGYALILIGVFWGWMHYEQIKRDAEARRKYQADVEKYKAQVANFKQSIGKIIAENQEKRKKYHKELDEYPRRVWKLEDTLFEAKKNLMDAAFPVNDALRALYNTGIIWEKYQNLVAVSTMYEYIASGRCDRLDGPYGAYNLYESELRQNIIIGQLSKIETHLEQIKENQNMLYYELRDANTSISRLLSGIEDDNMVSAFCNESIAKNIETMTYLETAQYLQHR